MTTTERSTLAREPVPEHEQKRVALGYLQEAWAEALHDGIDGDCLAQACLFAALAEFVTTYGEDARQPVTFTPAAYLSPFSQRFLRQILKQ